MEHKKVGRATALPTFLCSMHTSVDVAPTTLHLCFQHENRKVQGRDLTPPVVMLGGINCRQLLDGDTGGQVD